MKKFIAVILLVGLVAIPIIKTKINNAGTSEEFSLVLKLSHTRGMSKENYRDIYLLGVYLWTNTEFLKSVEVKLKENGIEDPHDFIDRIDIVAYPKEGAIELIFEDLNLNPGIEMVVAHAFCDEMAMSTLDGSMKAIERRRTQLEKMYEELDQLPEDDWKHYQLSRAIEAVSISGGFARVSFRPDWKIKYKTQPVAGGNG